MFVGELEWDRPNIKISIATANHALNLRYHWPKTVYGHKKGENHLLFQRGRQKSAFTDECPS